ncbi:MAG: hypothetical protein BA864_05185 [Desulfuromonadales bacterium C00003093]|nr:MAG: hypothetical protein BA864_05185 [Desulfuromonadales bacterium C00003093]
MLDLIIGLFGGQVGAVTAGVLALLVSVFGFAFKMRGSTIKQLEKDKAVEKVNNELLKREIKQVIQQEELQRDFNEVTEVVIKSSDSAVRDRLSGFNRD